MSQRGFAACAHLGRQCERGPELLRRLFELAAPACESAERHERRGLTRQVSGVAGDLQRLAEVLFGEIPLPQVVADEAEVLVVGRHAGVEARALVDLERLLEEPRGLAPLAQALVDEPQIVERRHQSVGVVDASERGGRVLEPLDRLARTAEPRVAHADRHPHLADGLMFVAVAHDRVRIEPDRLRRYSPRPMRACAAPAAIRAFWRGLSSTRAAARASSSARSEAS